jgi:hypothetical protein
MLRPAPGWDKLRVGARGPAAGPAPADLLGQQDPPDLAAAYPDASVPGRLGEGIEGPLRRPALIVRGQLPGPVAVQPPGRQRPGQRDDGRPLRLGDLPPAPGAGPVTELGFAGASHVGWWIIAGCGAAVLLLAIITTGRWAKATAERAASRTAPGSPKVPVSSWRDQPYGIRSKLTIFFGGLGEGDQLSGR